MKRTFKNFVFPLALSTALLGACSSAPKKTDHDLADMLLNKGPSLGVPDDSVETLSVPVVSLSDDAIRDDRENDKRHDELTYQDRISSFRQRFSSLQSAESGLPSNMSASDRARALQNISFEMDQLRVELERYRESPGTMFFYSEGAEREQILHRRSDEISALEASWTPQLSSLQEQISSARSVEALKSLQESVVEKAGPAPAAEEELMNSARDRPLRGMRN